MAKQGTFTAFQQLTPLRGSVVDDMRAAEEIGFQHRAEKRQIEQIAKQEEEKKKKEKDLLREKVAKNIQNYDTGSRSLNELQGMLIQKAVNEYIPIIETLENPNASEQDKLRAQLKADNISKLPENLKMVTDFYTEQDKLYRTGVANGTLFQNTDYEKIFQTGFENYILDLDDNGNPIVAFKDTNKDGKVDILDVQSYEQIKTGLPTFDFQRRYDYDELLKDATTKIQPEVNQTDNGSLVRETTGLNLVKARGYAENTFLKKDGTPTPALLSLARERGVDITSKESADKIISDFVNDMSLRTKGGVKDTRKDSNLEIQKEKRAAAKEAREEKKTTFDVVETPSIYAESKVQPATGYKTVAVTNSKPIPAIQIYENGKKKDVTNATIGSYTIIKNKSGVRQLAAEIVYQDSKSSTLSVDEMALLENINTPAETRELLLSKQSKGPENKSVVKILSEKDAVKYSKQLGFKDFNEMKSKARVGKEEQVQKETAAQRAARIANGG